MAQLVSKNSLKVSISSNQDGVVLILVAILCTVFILFTGLAIDTAITVASKAQQRKYAEYASLGALKMYYDTPGSPLDKLLAAQQRAQEITGLNILLGSSFQENSSLPQELGPVIAGGGITAEEGPNGKIIPGVWHFETPVDAFGACVGPSPCPCNIGSTSNVPCFQALNFNNPADQLIVPTAFKTILKLRDESPIRTLFAVVGGAKYTRISSFATATIIPTAGVFLLALNRASVSDTHLDYERVKENWASEYSFKLENKACITPSFGINPCLPLAGGAYPTCTTAGVTPGVPTDCQFTSVLRPPEKNIIYNSYCPTILPEIRDANFTSSQHAKADYKCFTVNYTEAGAGKTEHYLIDTFTGATFDNPSYRGPEPLTSYLEGLHHALTQVEKRNAGELVGIIGFDQSAEIKERIFPPKPPGTPEFEEMKTLTNVDVSDAQAQNRQAQRISKMLFPRVDAMQNLPAALNKAYEMLTTLPQAKSKEKFIAVLSDGISNCAGGVCGIDEFLNINPSVDESIQIISDKFKAEKIKLHFIMHNSGGTTGPHNLLRKAFPTNEDLGCMNEVQSLESGYGLTDFVSGASSYYDAFIKSSPYDTFFYPTKFYQEVQSTHGFWGPLRQKCEISTSGISLPASQNCENGGLNKYLSEKCKQQSSPGSLVGNIPSIVDPYGRLGCDPFCRDYRSQMKEYVGAILRESPYVVVE